MVKTSKKQTLHTEKKISLERLSDNLLLCQPLLFYPPPTPNPLFTFTIFEILLFEEWFNGEKLTRL